MIIVPLLFVAASQFVEADAQYTQCLAGIDENVESGRNYAIKWVSEGGGAAAMHCLAIADTKAGFYKLAAARLEEIADRKDAGDDFIRARLLSQAAEVWLKAEQNDFADAAISAAFELAPDSAELHLSAAKVHAAHTRWPDVIASVTLAEKSGFVSANTYVLRARAHQAFGDYEASAQDVVNALTLDAKNLDALVLRGELQQTGIQIDVFIDAATATN